MSSLIDSQKLLQKLTLGVVETIDSLAGVYNVKPENCSPADRHVVLTWEQKNSTCLPEDLKLFYLSSDGLNITWSVKMNNGPFQLGKLWINPIGQLRSITSSTGNPSGGASLSDLDDDGDDDDINDDLRTVHTPPSFKGGCKIFELDPCDGYGKVCLVYKDCQPGSIDPNADVWFLDRALRWHFLSDSFTSYYRLLLMHLGLPQWQYAFTDIGLSCQAKQWFYLFAPLRLELDLETPPVDPLLVSSNSELTQIDPTRLFKSKSDKKKQTAAASTAQGAKRKGVLTGNKTPTGNVKPGSSFAASGPKPQK